jgi:hypothetical protein
MNNEDEDELQNELELVDEQLLDEDEDELQNELELELDELH